MFVVQQMIINYYAAKMRQFRVFENAEFTPLIAHFTA